MRLNLIQIFKCFSVNVGMFDTSIYKSMFTLVSYEQTQSYMSTHVHAIECIHC